MPIALHVNIAVTTFSKFWSGLYSESLKSKVNTNYWYSFFVKNLPINVKPSGGAVHVTLIVLHPPVILIGPGTGVTPPEASMIKSLAVHVAHKAAITVVVVVEVLVEVVVDVVEVVL